MVEQVRRDCDHGMWGRERLAEKCREEQAKGSLEALVREGLQESIVTVVAWSSRVDRTEEQEIDTVYEEVLREVDSNEEQQRGVQMLSKLKSEN